jgi:hypothetical protein
MVAPTREFVRWLEQQTIATSGTATWGSIGGNINDQSDLSNLFLIVNTDIAALTADLAATDAEVATKQDTLVSGANIKTINGNSLLGSGDLAIATDLVPVAGGTMATADLSPVGGLVL